MARKKSSSRWLQEHFNDVYVKQAKAKGYRSRAAFKLLEIQEKDKLIRPGMLIVDLGAAPGGWSQIAESLVGAKGKVIALDILPMPALPGVIFIQGDFRELEVMNQVIAITGETTVDLLLSDMSPNITGIEDVDQIRCMHLAELSLLCARQILKAGGSLLVKVFQGVGFDSFMKDLRQAFTKVVVRKPDASRSRSREVYLLAKGHKK
ncbi:23S rRNA (uridine(2552)-2'-O)-methyltransferase RlmE [soil metagenome]